MKTVISASRRTDMPACHLDVLAGAVQCGYIDVPNPYSGRSHRVDMSPENVHTLVLWSKDFGPFLGADGILDVYHLYFLFTINDMPSFEPSVPPLDERIAQAVELAARYGPERVAWRFDPVIFTTDGPVMSVRTFGRIAGPLADAGITRAIFSFLDLYGKVRVRNDRLSLGIVEPQGDEIAQYVRDLAAAAKHHGMTLERCAGEDAGVPGVKRSSCIDGALLGRLAGEPAPLKTDSGQRDLCGCTVSRDIGSYRDMPCPNGCLYCYANPILNRTCGVMPGT